jgi:hypothetical protein
MLEFGMLRSVSKIIDDPNPLIPNTGITRLSPVGCPEPSKLSQPISGRTRTSVSNATDTTRQSTSAINCPLTAIGSEADEKNHH